MNVNLSDVLYGAAHDIELDPIIDKNNEKSIKARLVSILREQLGGDLKIQSELSPQFYEGIKKLPAAEIDVLVKVYEAFESILDTPLMGIDSATQEKLQSVVHQQLKFLQSRFPEKSALPEKFAEDRPAAVDLSKIANILKKPTISSEDILEISAISKENYNALFLKGMTGASALDAIYAKSTPKTFMLLIEILINNPKNLTKENQQKIKEFIFFKKTEKEESAFELLMSGDPAHANQVFEKIFVFVDNEDLNAHEKWRDQVCRFAFSPVRYEALLIQDSDVTPVMKSAFDTLYAKCRRPDLDDRSDRIRASPERYAQWRKLRANISSSISRPITTQAASTAGWEKAEKYISGVARSKRSSERPFEFGILQNTHRRLTTGELASAGRTRDHAEMDISETVVKVGGSWTRLYCPSDFLRKRLPEFEVWLNRELEKCDKGDANPIILAVQAYQRIASLHPFANGNGRLGRLCMDYIFERYGIPPLIMTEDIQTAIFPLETKRIDFAALSKYIYESVVATNEHFMRLSQ